MRGPGGGGWLFGSLQQRSRGILVSSGWLSFRRERWRVSMSSVFPTCSVSVKYESIHISRYPGPEGRPLLDLV